MNTTDPQQQFDALGLMPWTLFLLAVIPLMLLIAITTTYPTRRMASLLALPMIGSVMLYLWSSSLLVVAILDLAILIFAIVDLVTIPFLRALSVERSMPRVASLGGWHPVELTFSYRGSVPLRVELTDDAVDGLKIQPPSHQMTIAPGSRTIFHHRLMPDHRGNYELEVVYVWLNSRFGLWRRKRTLPAPGSLHVYPNIQQISEYALLARTGRLNLIGVRKTRRAGQENNFERLRDYQADDNYKHIDWRCTARRQRLTVKQFQTDQSQRIIFMLDCGRMMTNQYQNLSLVDYSLNSLLLLSYVALSQGDSVGLICFSDRIHNFVPPVGGKRQMNRLLHAGFNQFPRMVQSRFDSAFLYLSTHCRRRSLVVLISNVIDQVNADQIQNYMGNLIGCHLPLVVLLRDHSLFQFADNPAPDDEVLYRSAAASQILLWRHQVIRRMQADGSLVLDVFPEEMTSPLVNKYLEIKARHLL